MSEVITIEVPDSCILGSMACSDVYSDEDSVNSDDVNSDDDTAPAPVKIHTINDDPNQVHLYGDARMQKDPEPSLQ